MISVPDTQRLRIRLIDACGLLALGVAMLEIPRLAPASFPGEVSTPNGRALWLEGMGSLLVFLGSVNGLLHLVGLLASTRARLAGGEGMRSEPILSLLAGETGEPALSGFDACDYAVQATDSDLGQEAVAAGASEDLTLR